MNFIFCHVQFCIWGLMCAAYWLHSKVRPRTSIYYCCRNIPSWDGAIGEVVVNGENFLIQIDQCVTRKRTNWRNTPNNDALGCSLGNIISVWIRVLLA